MAPGGGSADEHGPLLALGLGANLADSSGRPPAAVLATACTVLRARLHLHDARVSRLYRSELWLPPHGTGTAKAHDPPQPPYLNAVLVGRCRLAPEAVLAVAQALELAAGRQRRERNAARTLDVDLLLYGDVQLRRPELTVPHPRLHQRLFALLPLAELEPQWPFGAPRQSVQAWARARLDEERHAPEIVPWPQAPSL